MSKRAKTRAAQERKREKARRKAAEVAKYEAWRDAGTNSKSKRFLLRTKRARTSPTKHQHLVWNCGNPGCKGCFPRNKVNK